MTEYQQREKIHRSSTVTEAIFHTAIAIALSQVCESMGWDYGEAWIPNERGTILEISPAWYFSTRVHRTRVLIWEEFRRCSQDFILFRGEGLPGRAWLSQQPQWVCDASAESETTFIRHQIAQDCGVKAGLAVPIIANSKAIAIFVFFMSKACAKDPQLIARTQAKAMQLGKLSPRFPI